MNVTNSYGRISKETWLKACDEYMEFKREVHYSEEKKEEGFLYFNRDGRVACRLLEQADLAWKRLSIEDIIQITRDRILSCRLEELRKLDFFLANITPNKTKEEEEIQKLIKEIRARALEIKKPSCRILLEELARISIPVEQPAAWLLQYQLDYYRRELGKGETIELATNIKNDIAYFKNKPLKKLNTQAYELILRELKKIQKRIRRLAEEKKIPVDHTDPYLIHTTKSFFSDPNSNKIEEGNKILKSGDNYQGIQGPTIDNPKILAAMISRQPDLWDHLKQFLQN